MAKETMKTSTGAHYRKADSRASLFMLLVAFSAGCSLGDRPASVCIKNNTEKSVKFEIVDNRSNTQSETVMPGKVSSKLSLEPTDAEIKVRDGKTNTIIDIIPLSQDLLRDHLRYGVLRMDYPVRII